MKALRTEEEIRIYLLLSNKDVVEEKLIADALQVEKKYEKELLEGKYEYSTYADFHNNPFVLEDEDKVLELKFIEQIGGIVVYEPIFKEDADEMNGRYTWDELYKRADGAACGEPRLRAKDNARFILTEIIKEVEGYDIDECECPEEEIDRFLDNADEQYLFDEDGNLVGGK